MDMSLDEAWCYYLATGIDRFGALVFRSEILAATDFKNAVAGDGDSAIPEDSPFGVQGEEDAA
jgi:hypothetical protein